ncbi:hypothetical protein CVU75_03715, partial [Candidatus Dependentiae bacterium HGW-Dependentiae-1]
MKKKSSPLYPWILALLPLAGTEYHLMAQQPPLRTITQDVLVNKAHEQAHEERLFHFHQAIPRLTFLAAKKTTPALDGKAVSEAVHTFVLNLYTRLKTPGSTKNISENMYQAIRSNDLEELKLILYRQEINPLFFSKLLTQIIAHDNTFSDHTDPENKLFEFALHRGHNIPQHLLVQALETAKEQGRQRIIRRLTGPEAQKKGTVIRGDFFNLWNGYPLHKAIFEETVINEDDISKFLLEHPRITINQEIDFNSLTPLHVAAYIGSERTLQALINLGASVNAQNMDGFTPLHYAAKAGHIHAAQLLIESGASIDARSGEAGTPLYYAAGHGHVSMTEFLSEQSNETMHTPFIINPLAAAISNGHTQATDIILKTHYTRARETPQAEHNAHEWPLPELRNADIKRRGLTPTQQNAFEWPLLYATEFEHNDILEKIAQTAGTIIDAYDRHSYQTALHRLVKKNNLQGVEIVLHYGASTNVVDAQGNTPLWTAIYNKNLPMIQLLLAYTPVPTTGQQPHYQFLDQKEHIIEEPLLTAIRSNYPEAIAVLLKHEATGLQTNTLAQRLALHYAINQRNSTALQLLLDHGA